ncbi:MAG: MYXO-CTERM sorting domain-containing protein [Myxococcales bacterium]|nr:MYXO-CTERM sorting domain-containing protein [Myxococcales bacterium]MCB9715572.1 MYXO-CTERM sorting domain-containing protein [Myxococcales bacterium]
MKRTCLISCALTAAVLAPASASAEPGILYIPTEAVTLRPTGLAPCGSDVNSALGCGGASSETEEPPYADAANLTTSVADNLVAYDVMVTNTRPPEYISYTMLLPGDTPLEMDAGGYQSFTCTFGGKNCGALARNRIYSTSGTTQNCIDPEIVHASMFAFGRSAGLEGVTNPEDWMNYVVDVGPLGGPDYATPPMGFQDVCNDRVEPQGFDDRGMQISLPLDCTSLDHVACDGPGGEQGQNSHQDLMEFFGARVEDTEAPVLTNIVPEDGTTLAAGDDLVLDVDIADADPVVGVRWTIQSEAIVNDTFPEGILDQCTNDVCFANWNDALPLKATDSDWNVTLEGLPAGDYVITLEAADYHGNIADMVTINVTIEGGTSDETGGSATGGNDETGNDTNDFTTGANDDTGGNDTANADGGDDTSGCSCTTSGSGREGAAFMLLGLMGLGAMRRRRR